MDKKILLICLIAIVAFSISCVSAADSNEIAMNSSDAVGISEDVSVDDVVFANQISSEDSQVVGDSPSGEVWVATTGSDDNDGSQASPVASVSKAVDLAQSGSTIHIKEGTYNQGKISLNKTLSFVGEGNVILSSNGANVFGCLENDCTLEFTNLVFTGVSSASGSSCGLSVGGNGNLKVINCTFTDISAKFGAMQLYTTGVADIINSTIKDVVSGASNGCIVYISGSGTYNFNNLSIINPKLADSVVAGSQYAFLRNVFYLNNKEATVTLTNSIITGASGPMQAVVESRSKLTISNTVISNNVVGKTTASYGKYLLYVGDSTALNMTNCIIENNTFADSSSALIYFNSACKANITYSSIVDNGFSKNVDVKSGITPTVNLDYNWWGTNTYTGDNVNKWVVMSTPETTINAESGKAIDVSVNFNHYTDASGSIQDLAQSISGINVDFSAVSGTLSKNNVASVDGIATVTYTTTTNDKITAKSGSQSLTIDVVAKQAAADIWVATTGSDDNDGSQANPVATIAKAIELAGDGYTIHIADGNYVNDKTLSISKSLTLEGSANTVIDGNASKIMEVTADATVVLTNLSFTNGNDALVGAISNEGKLTISNSNFYSNKATGNSGTIITNKNKLNINNSKFYQNSAGKGVVNNQNDALLVIDNSEFYNNDMTSFSNSYGIVYTTSANATISNTVFRNNAVKYGGAIYATKSSDATIGIVNIINSTFESNNANTGQGGALFVSGGECIIKESMFINNKANPGKFSGGQGGAIYTSLNGNVSVADSVFKNNQAKLGAALYLNGGSNSTISYSVLLNNVAEGDYAISNAESASGVATVNYNWWGTNSPKNLVPSTVTLNNWVIMSADPTTVTDAEIGDVKTISVNFNKYSSFDTINDLSKPLPAIDVEFSAVNGTLASNLVSTVNGVAAVSYTVNGNDQIAVKSGSQTLTIEVVAKLPVTDVWVSASGSDANDGSQDSPVATIAKAIELVAEGYTIHVGEGTYIANSLTIAKSFAMIGSGKVIIDGNASKIMNINENTIVNFTNVAFTNALNNFGGVMQSKGTVNLNNVSIYKNTQKSGSTPTVSSMYNTGVMTIVNSNIYENDGYGLIFNSGNLDIINTSISSNNVAKGTTYAFLYIDSGAVNVINSTLSDNTARLGGIWLNKGTLNVNNATFENNVVTVGNGGAIHIESDSSTATIKDSKFIGNKANKDGGAIYNKGALNIETSIFDANAASNGNTGYHGDDIYNSGILTLHYSALLGKGTNKLIYNEGREPSANAQYNWWGTNSNPSTLVGAGLDYDDEPCDDVDVSNWVVMSVDPTSIEKVIVGNEKTLTVNFNHYNANGVIKELAKSIPSINVNFEAVNGTLSSDVAATDNGVASVTYTVKGNDQITVKSGSQTLTVPVTTKELTNIVTNETFFIYFDEDGLLREEVPFDELIFKGEFSDIVNLISITTPLKITSDNAVLRNIAFAVLSDNVVLNGLTLISNVSCADNGGALILVAGNNVNVSNMNISYIIKESVDAVAINANGVSNLNVVNSNIFFESCPKDDTLTASAINIDGVSNSFINGNNITAVLPYLFASNYDMKYFMMGVNTVNPIRMRECNNVTFSKNNVNTTANDGSASFPTLQCMFIVGSNDCVIDGNNFSMIDTLIPAGTSNYLYGINIGYNKNLMISNNDFKMSTAGGKDAAGTAYAIQGVECEVSMIGNNITSISNGPNLGIYFASMTGGTSELYIANNLINVTGLASASGSWALVSGIEVQNGNAKIYNNTVYTYNVGDYSPENYMYGISYAQYMYGDRSFDIRDNRIYVDGHYAVSFINVDGSNVTGNLLITRDLGGDAAVEIKAGKNNVVENNYPRSSDLIFNITSEEPGKILIDVTIDKKATGNIAVVVDGDKYDVAIVNGSAKLTLSDLPAGVYYIEAKYNGNSIVTESYNSTKFTIDLIDSSIAVEAKDIKCGEEAVITATVTNGATGTVTFFVNGKTYVVDITDSVATLKIADLTTGDYPVFAYYNGDKYYKTSYNSTTFNVAKLASTTTVNVSDIKVGEDAVISIAVPEITSGVVSVTVGDAIYNVAVVDGKGSLTLSGLASGSYDVVAKFNGDDKYLASEDSAKFNVTKLASTIDIAVDNIKVGEDAVIGVALPEAATGEVIISVNGKNYTVMTKYGMASVTISDLANGTYSVDAFYNGDDIYAPIKNSTAFTVSKVSDYNMTVDIADIIKGENATITVSVPEDGTGNVIVTINGTDYKGTVVNGTAKVIIPGLDEGTYKVVTFYTGDNKYDSMSVNGTITVNKNTKTTLTMDNLVKYFNGPQKLMAKLVDGFGNPIANATVYFTINGRVYARITDENGTASIAIRLLPGEYKASALFNGTKDHDKATANATVTVKSTIFGNDTTLYFRNGTQYMAKFLDSDGKALANTDVKFNINGVFYTRVTDENGIARLNIRLDPASYIITAYNPVTGEQKANNITVLPRIIAKDLSMKYLDGSSFNATLVDGQGKAISGVNITFNINGVFYHRTTNADGVTKLNIRLMPGEYIITSMYDECWASNKIIISA